ncbi:D-sedoheptulose 7-phosphate isomerase [Geomonas nitrogeniifigens]|uniref:D-sedoheptulose 7-phosphate isomerase n=1 Tax=Geomonas diazotrophica TaxID=2843197 RepID=UPI001C2BE83D|nr:D-sedoheptulose 7-phosphate isomerase [Geomonas nitrogeniifigens]QXE88285.1 D-sedoheptulose 7-phosphate isomerase [Geomonas nitrogeniifigens]
MKEEIKAQLQAHAQVIAALERDLCPSLESAVSLLAAALRDGKKLLVFGNGGSAADAQHFAAEIVGRFKLERRALPAIALSTDTSILTAVGNDYGFERIFSRQVEAHANPGDVLVGISTSGNSPNVKLALETGKRLGCRSIALLGKDGGSIKGVAELSLVVPSDDTPRIQEGHITMIHILCDLVERELFS